MLKDNHSIALGIKDGVGEAAAFGVCLISSSPREMSRKEDSSMKKMKSIVDMGVNLLIAIAAIAILYRTFVPSTPAFGAGKPPAITDMKEILGQEFVRNTAGIGDIAIVEFIDFQCPYCAQFALDTIPALGKELGDKVQFITVNFPLTSIHKQAIAAAVAAECAADQGKYWEMHELLFQEQKSLPTVNVVALGERLGLERERFATCLQSDEMLAKVRADAAEGQRLGVNGTPSFFIGKVREDGGIDLMKRLPGAVPVEAILNEVTNLK